MFLVNPTCKVITLLWFSIQVDESVSKYFHMADCKIKVDEDYFAQGDRN